MKCSVCKKKESKWFVMGQGAPRTKMYGFCSKVCIANNAIRHYRMVKDKNE